MIREWRSVTANVLTGFLGSGKTSLLKRLLAQPDLHGTAVLINEFGEIGLDHLLVEEVDQEVVLLKSGCVCCSIRGDLRDGLDRLHARMERGEVQPFERVVIETTGLADPVPIVTGFSTDPSLRWHFKLGAVVTVVDAVNGAANLDRFEEAARQVAAVGRPAPDGHRGARPARRGRGPCPPCRWHGHLLPDRRHPARLGRVRPLAVAAAAPARGRRPAGEGSAAGTGRRPACSAPSSG